jgi:hypothetical protein
MYYCGKYLFVGTSILVALFFPSCKQSIDGYAEKLVYNSLPGKYCQRYLNQMNDQSRLQTLSSSYIDIIERWSYAYDAPGRDTPRNADELFRSGSYSGDCEDQAVALCAIASELKFKTRFCLGRKLNKDEGHVWLEVLIGDDSLNNDLIESLFPNTSIIEEGMQYWLAFISDENIKNYQVEYYVNVN